MKAVLSKLFILQGILGIEDRISGVFVRVKHDIGINRIENGELSNS